MYDMYPDWGAEPVTTPEAEQPETVTVETVAEFVTTVAGVR